MQDRRISLKRSRYFSGQLLDEQDFSDEQSYHLEGRRRHAKTLHTAGVVGLEVTRQGTRSVQIAPGIAIDTGGREIVVAEPFTLTLSDSAASVPVYVTIEYEESDDPVDSSGDPATDSARTTEYAIARLGSIAPRADGTTLLLARIPLDEKGNLGEPDLSARQLAGARIAAGSVGTAEIARAAVTREKLDPALRGGWVRLPFKPSPLREQKDPTKNSREFVIGVTRAFCDEQGAQGTLAIPVPPGAERLKEVVVAGPTNQAGIELVIYKCGWNTATKTREETPSPTINIPAGPAPFAWNVQLNWQLDPRGHAVALYVRALGRSEISLVAAAFE